MSHLDEINLEKLSDDELDKLEKMIEKQHAIRHKERMRRARDEMRDIAKRYGVDVKDLVPGAAQKKKAVSEATYRHPEDESVTWSGRGRRPKWINDWLDKGRDLNDLKI